MLCGFCFVAFFFGGGGGKLQVVKCHAVSLPVYESDTVTVCANWQRDPKGREWCLHVGTHFGGTFRSTSARTTAAKTNHVLPEELQHSILDPQRFLQNLPVRHML